VARAVEAGHELERSGRGAPSEGTERSGRGHGRPSLGLAPSRTAGVPTRDIQEALRHRDERTTAAYLHTSEGEKTRAINLLPSRR
jgi:integrase